MLSGKGLRRRKPSFAHVFVYVTLCPVCLGKDAGSGGLQLSARRYLLSMLAAVPKAKVPISSAAELCLYLEPDADAHIDEKSLSAPPH